MKHKEITMELTQEELKEILHYDPTTGIFSKNTRKHIKGYTVISIKNKPYLAHRLAWLYSYGHFPKQIDHVNHNKTDNRLSNLREVTNRENHRNKPLTKSNTSGAMGVSWAKRDKKWRARIMIDSKEIHLGTFEDKEEAIKARQEANIKYGFHENHGKARLVSPN